MGFAERNITSSFEFVKSQIEALSEQGRELGKRVAKMSGQGTKQ